MNQTNHIRPHSITQQDLSKVIRIKPHPSYVVNRFEPYSIDEGSPYRDVGFFMLGVFASVVFFVVGWFL